MIGKPEEDKACAVRFHRPLCAELVTGRLSRLTRKLLLIGAGGAALTLAVLPLAGPLIPLVPLAAALLMLIAPPYLLQVKRVAALFSADLSCQKATESCAYLVHVEFEREGPPVDDREMPEVDVGVLTLSEEAVIFQGNRLDFRMARTNIACLMGGESRGLLLTAARTCLQLCEPLAASCRLYVSGWYGSSVGEMRAYGRAVAEGLRREMAETTMRPVTESEGQE